MLFHKFKIIQIKMKKIFFISILLFALFFSFSSAQAPQWSSDISGVNETPLAPRGPKQFIMDENQNSNNPIVTTEPVWTDHTIFCYLGPDPDFSDLLDYFTVCILKNKLLPIALSLAVAVFIFGVIKYVIAVEEKEREKSKQFIVYGLISLTVLVSLWGLSSLLTGSFGVKNATPGVQSVST